MKIGTLIKSTSGRDKNTYYMVKEILDNKFVLVVDGNIRKLNNPKKKSRKHFVEICNLEKIGEKIIENKQIFDKEVNKAINMKIKEINSSNEENS